jgi:hypothetical protein
MSKPSTWINKLKYPNRKYLGGYQWVRRERQFILTTCQPKSNHVVVYESHEQAKDAGWRKDR